MRDSLLWKPQGSRTPFLPQGKHPQYAHPFEDLASVAMPTNIQEGLRWAQILVSTLGPYRSALRRVVAYCITEPEIVESKNSGSNATGKEVKENYEKIFSDSYLQISRVALENGMDLLTYGNVFLSVFNRFTRYLICQGEHGNGKPCRVQIPLKQMLEHQEAFKFRFEGFQFKATCPYCGSTSIWKIYDQYGKSMEDVFVHRWNPRELELINDPFSPRPAVLWNIPADYIAKVKKAIPDMLLSIPTDVLDAIRENGKFRFNDDMILHLKTSTLAGLDLDGWGLPGPLADFRQAWLYQVCNRHTETTAMEALAPMRILSPPSGGANGDPLYKGNNMGHFRQVMQNAVNTKRRDPSAWFVMPFPVQYQSVGGDAAQFIPRDLLDFSLDALLTSAGVPVEMYKGSLTIQSAPVALRLFSSYWRSLVTDLNIMLQFIARRVSEILGWEPVEARFAKITEADDINRQVQALQLMGTGAVSQTTALASVGIDKKEEVRRIIEEQRDEAEQQDRMQKEMETTKQLTDMIGGGTLNILGQLQQQQQQAAQGGGGGAPPMGMPGQNMPVPGATMAGATVPGANGPGMSSLLPGMDPISQLIAQSGIQPTDSIQDIYAKAQTLAQQLMMGNTNSNLRKLQKQDPQMHMIVKGLIEQMRSEAASQGRDMVLQQQGMG